MNYEAINFQDKLTKFSNYWSPRVIAELNGYQFKLAKVKDEFVWHTHEDTDEVFIVIEGSIKIEFRDGDVNLNEGEMFVLPKGVENKPFAKKECKVMFVKPKGVVNTGDSSGELTAQNDVWI